MKGSIAKMSSLLGVAVLAIVLAIVAGLTFKGSESATAATTGVAVGQDAAAQPANGFNANSATISSGDSVQWTWFDGTHNVTSFNRNPDNTAVWGTTSTYFDGDPSTAPVGVTPETFSRAFNNSSGSPSTEWYFCTFHGRRTDIDTNNDGVPGGAGDTPDFTKMIGKVVVNSTPPPPQDSSGPIVSNVVANGGQPTNGAASVPLTATVSDATTGNSNVSAAEYSTGAAAAAPGAGTAMSGEFNSPTVNVSANVPIPASLVPPATLTIWVRGLDAAGNWGAAASTTLNATDPPAGTIQATLSIGGGGLSNTAQDIAFGYLTLTGADQTVAASQQIWQAKDARGTAAGWNVTVSSSDFTGAGTIAAANNFKTRLLQTNVSTVAGNAPPQSQALSFQSLGGTPLKILAAALNEGMGTYDYIPEFQLTIPASAMEGAYSANVSVSVNSGP